MDKNVLGHYGWIVCTIVVLAIMIALASPLALAIKDGVVGSFNVMENEIDNAFDNFWNNSPGNGGNKPGGNGGGNGSGGSGSGGSGSGGSGTPDKELPVITHGQGQTYYTLAPSTLSFRSSAPFDEFQEVRVNGVTVDPSYYTVTEGSTIIELSIDYLDTLAATNYTITVVSDGGSPSTEFAVVNPELNKHGVYYNQPYYCGWIELGMHMYGEFAFVFRL